MHGENFSPISWFVALGMWSEGNAPKNGKPTVGFSFKTPTHWTVLFKYILEKNNVTTLQHLPHPRDLVQLISRSPRLKLALKELRFFDATDIIKNATEELKMLSQNGSHKFFQRLYSHCAEVYICARGPL